MKHNYYIKTMGCQMNAHDSDYLSRLLIKKWGYHPVASPEKADIVLVNTCAVRAKPEQKAASFMGRMVRLKKKKSGMVLGIIGCMAQKEGPELFKRFPTLDLVAGPRELDQIPAALHRILEKRKKVIATHLDPPPPKPLHCKGYFKGRITGFVSIMEGCNNFCTYCIIPYVRGREVSRSPGDILADAKALIADGVKDITLLGQSVLSYQWEKKDIVFVFKELDALQGLLRLRFTTSHPKDLSDDIIASFRDVVKLCPHIHLPFQSGSNAILKKMKRGYTREAYMERVEKLRRFRPDIAITSDVMVGFPGETEEDFLLTLDLIEKIGFDALFSFKYSDRPGTVAQKMQNKVATPVKSRRLRQLQELQQKITTQKNQTLKGSQVDVLIEGQSKKGGQFTGKTGTNKIVNLSSNNNIIGNLVQVKIKESYAHSLRA